jgi:Concanavalin A-like lectin/glucanases superfamily
MWINATSFPSGYNSMWGLFATGAGFKTYVKGNQKLAFFIGNSAVYDGIGTATLFAGTWYHLAFTTSVANSLSVGYVNGVSDGSNAGVTGATFTPSPSFKLGDDGNALSRYWNGRMSDACIWSVALTANEIKLLASGLRAKYVRPERILAYYPLSGLQPYEPDVSPYANHGTLNGPSFGPEYPFIPDMNEILLIPQEEEMPVVFSPPPPSAAILFARSSL